MSGTVVRELLTIWGIKVDDKQLKKFGKRLSDVKDTARNVSIAVGGMLAGIAIPAMALEDNIAQALTISGTHVKDFEKNRDKLSDLAMSIGEDLGMSAKEVSASYYQVLSTGAKLGTEAFESFTRAALKFAKVGAIDTANAVEYLDGTIKAFNLDASDAGNVADVLQTTSFKAAINIAQLTESMKNAGSVSNDMGLSLEETSTILAGMGEKFLKGGEAGNALSIILRKVKKTGSTAQVALSEMKIKPFEDGEFIGMINLLEKMKVGMKDMNQQQKAQKMIAIAGDEGEKALSGLLQQDISKFRAWKSELENSTGAVDAGLKLLRKRASDVGKSFFNAGTNLAIIFGTQFLDLLKPVLKRLTTLLIIVKDFINQYKGFAKLVTGIMAMVFAISSLTYAYTLLLPKVIAFKLATLTTFAVLMIKIVIVIAAMVALYLIIQEIVGFFTGKDSVIGLWITMVETMIVMLKAQWGAFKEWMKVMWLELTIWMSEKITGIFDPIKDFFQKLLPYQNKIKVSQKLETANNRNDGFASSGNASGGKVDISISPTIVVPAGANAEDTQKSVKDGAEKAIKDVLLKTYRNFQPVIQG